MLFGWHNYLASVKEMTMEWRIKEWQTKYKRIYSRNTKFSIIRFNETWSYRAMMTHSKLNVVMSSSGCTPPHTGTARAVHSSAVFLHLQRFTHPSYIYMTAVHVNFELLLGILYSGDHAARLHFWSTPSWLSPAVLVQGATPGLIHDFPDRLPS